MGEERNAFVPGHPLGGSPAFWEFMCAAAEVEVDVETGMVRILRIVLVSDVGKALNPHQVEGQDEGSAVMGIGHTLMEHLILDDRGRIRNLGALDYRIPTVQDIPFHLESILVEHERVGPQVARQTGQRARHHRNEGAAHLEQCAFRTCRFRIAGCRCATEGRRRDGEALD